MSAYRKKNRNEILEMMKYGGAQLTEHEIRDLIKIIEEHEKRITELEGK